MMKQVLFFWGFLWALPISIFGFALGLFLYLARQLDFVFWDFKDFTVVFDLKNDGWFHRKKFEERGWIGYSCGCNIFIKDIDDRNLRGAIRKPRTLNHEKRHCYQQYVLGVFLLIAYVVNSVFIWLFLKNKHSYYDNWFERDARKYAGQPVEIAKSEWADGPNSRWAFW